MLAEIGVEMVTTRDLIHAELAPNPQALQIWKAMEQGYMWVFTYYLTIFRHLYHNSHWHLTLERYKLADLGLLASFSKH